MKGKILISFISLFFVSTMSFAYTYVRMLGSPGGVCTPGPSSPESYEAAEGCVTVGDSRCYGSMQVTDMSCPDPTEASLNFILTNVGTAVTEQSINGVQMGTESVVARDAFNTFVNGTALPTCPSPYLAGASGDGYIFSTSAAVDGVGSDIHLTMWRRVDCSSSGSSGSLTPIGGIGGGSGGSGGGSATDMGPTNTLITQSNTLLTDINTKLSAPSGGGGTATDMTATNELLTGIDTGIKGTGGTNELLGDVKNSLSGPSTLPSAPASSVPAPYTSPYLTDHIPTSDDYVSEFNSFKTKMETTTFYGLIHTFFNVPAIGGGSSVFSFNAGKLGNHSYDFSSWGGIMALLRGLVIIAFGAAAMRILFLKGGS